MSKFHGLSSPNDLIEMWQSLKHDSDPKTLHVIWDFISPEQLNDGINICNIRFNQENPEEVGHYVCIIKDPLSKQIIYFDPISSMTHLNLHKISVINQYAESIGYSLYIDLSGTQKTTSENCGYHCFTYAFNWYRKPEIQDSDDSIDDVEENDKIEDLEGGVLPKNASISDKLDDIIKLLRAIYYGNRYGYSTFQKKKDMGNTWTQKKKETTKPNKTNEQKGSGLADDVPANKIYSFTALRDEIEN